MYTAEVLKGVGSGDCIDTLAAVAADAIPALNSGAAKATSISSGTEILKLFFMTCLPLLDYYENVGVKVHRATIEWVRGAVAPRET